MNITEQKILIVDDEPNFITQFKQFLESKGYKIVTAENVIQALDKLKENKVCVVITDQRMPGKKGVDLLAHVTQLYPDIIRVLITGYSDLDAVICAVNQGSIYRYISKNSLPEEISIVVDQCIDKYRQDQEIKRLSLANQRLLRMLSAEQNLSTVGIFGQQVSNKIEEIVMGLSGYLFKEAGSEDPAKLKEQFKYLDIALRRIRNLSLLTNTNDQEKSQSISINDVMQEEVKHLHDAMNKEKLYNKIKLHLDPQIPMLSLKRSSLKKLFKELLENAVLFSVPADQNIYIKTLSVPSKEDPHIEIMIINRAVIDQNTNLSQFFAPFYTSLGQIKFPETNSDIQIDSYNFKTHFHYGMGLSLAQWLAAKMGGFIEIKRLNDQIVTQFNLPM